MEGFDKAVLPGASRLDVDGLDLVLGQPTLERLGDKLRSVVGPDELGSPVLDDGPLYQADDVAGFRSPIEPSVRDIPGCGRAGR